MGGRLGPGGWRRGRAGVAVAAVVLLGAACGAPPEPPQQLTATAQEAVPADLGTAFEQLLGHHATLAARLVRTGMRGDDDLVEATDQALVANTDDLGAIVEGLFGAEAAQQFERLWATHLASLFDYASAVAEGETAQRDRARAELEQYSTGVASFLAGATGGRIPEATLAEAFTVHVGHLTGEADAYGAGDFERAYQLQRDAFAHVFPLGRTLAAALAAETGRPPVPMGDPAQQHRSTWGQLLGEHFELGVDAMRAATSGAAEFSAAAGALAANTAEITGSLDALFGPERAAGFNQAWADHVDLLVAYTTALAEGDDDAREAARGDMGRYREAVAQTFNEATGGRIPPAALQATLSTHDDHLVQQIEAYANGDFATAYDLSYEGYSHMFDLAAALAPAIEAQLATQAPVGAAQTGGGGTAPGG